MKTSSAQKTVGDFNIKYILFISLVSALGGFLFGYDLLVISGAKQFYELAYGLTTPVLQGWAVSSCIVGCIIGALVVGKAADQFGRVKLLILSALLFFISAIGSGYAPDFSQFVIYRLIGGIGMGMASTLSPMYIAEVSPAKFRGRFVSLNQLTIVLGILLAQLVNYMIVEHKPVPKIIQQESALAADLHIKTTALAGSKEGGYTPDIFTAEQKTGILKGEILTSVPKDIVDVATLKSLLESSSPIPPSLIDLNKLTTYTNAQLADTWNGKTGWYVVAFALLAVAVFAATLGPVAWVLISEIFPNSIRGVAMSIAVLSLWVANFILSFTFPILRDTLGPAGTFWTYAAICLAGIFLIKAFIPETKGKSLEKIESELLGKR